MKNNNAAYISIIELANSLLNLSLEQIKNKYENYPICIIDYKENEVKEKSFEIRFDNDEFTITCIFDSDEKCKLVFLFPDKNEIIDNMIVHLNNLDTYDFKKGRWTVSQCFMGIKKLDKSGNDFYLVFYK